MLEGFVDGLGWQRESIDGMLEELEAVEMGRHALVVRYVLPEEV